MDDASDMSSISVNKNYYLLNDIDFEGKTWAMPSAAYRGIIEGNGFTIRNISLAITQASNYYFGLFSALNGAKINNLTFENCNIEVKFGRTNDIFVGFLAGQIVGNTVLNNVNVALTAPHSSVTVIRDGGSAANATISWGKIAALVDNDVEMENCDFESIDYSVLD